LVYGLLPDLVPRVQPETGDHSCEEISGLRFDLVSGIKLDTGDLQTLIWFPVSSRRFDKILNNMLYKMLEIIVDNILDDMLDELLDRLLHAISDRILDEY
jgi:hypothetical protein